MVNKKKIEVTKEHITFGGVELSVLNQDPAYIPALTPDIIMSEKQAHVIGLCMASNMPLLLQGEAGTGKTSVARLIAHKRKQGYTRINMHGYATPDELIGSKSVKDGSTYHEDGVLTKAMKEGHLVVLDEINATPPDCLFILHGLLDDDRRITLPNGEVIRPHKDFRFIATMNPDYEGTKSLNRAFIDRFPAILSFNTLDALKESELIRDRCGIDLGVASLMVVTAKLSRKNYQEQKSLTYISTRTLLQWGMLVKESINIKDAYEICIANKARLEEKTAFLDFYNITFKDSTTVNKENEIVFISAKDKEKNEEMLRDAQNVATRLITENGELIKMKSQFEEMKREASMALEYKADNEKLKVKLNKLEEVLKLV